MQGQVIRNAAYLATVSRCTYPASPRALPLRATCEEQTIHLSTFPARNAAGQTMTCRRVEAHIVFRRRFLDVSQPAEGCHQPQSAICTPGLGRLAARHGANCRRHADWHLIVILHDCMMSELRTVSDNSEPER